MSVQDKKAASREVRITSAERVPAKTLTKSEDAAPPQSIMPFKRGAQEVKHHLFKAEVAQFLKNDSFKKDNPLLIPMEHAHIYHSCDSLGRPIAHTGFVGGHCHEVKIDNHPDGSITVECGPPLKKEVYKGRDGRKKTRFVPVKFFDKYAGEDDESATGGEWKVDAHTHILRYIGTETWSGEEMMARGGRKVAPMDDGLAGLHATIQKAGVSITE